MEDKTFETWRERFHYIFDSSTPIAPTYSEFVGTNEFYHELTTEEAIMFCLLIQESRK